METSGPIGGDDGGSSSVGLLIGVGVAGLVVGAIVSNILFNKKDSGPQQYYARGISEIQAKNYDGAIKDLGLALQSNPSDAASRFALGWAYQLRGWMEPALKQYEQATQSAVETINFAQFNLGTALMTKGKPLDTRAAYEKLLTFSPRHDGALFNLGFLEFQQGRADVALRYLVTSTEVNPKNPTAHFYAALCAEKLGKRDEAKKHLKAALAINPGYKEALDKLKALGG